MLIVERSPAVRERLLACVVEERDVAGAEAVPDAGAAIQALERCPYAVTVVDVDPGGDAGVELVATIRRRWAGCAVVVLSAAPGDELRARCAGLGATAVLSKLHDLDSFVALVRRLAGTSATA